MANSGALIKESIWRDRDFRRLPRLTQCTYMQLLSQKEIDCAGLLTLNMPLLAKGCEELTEDDLENDLAMLEERRFVFVDLDTFEVFVRAYMRSAQVTKSPNVFKSALKCARMVESPKIRVEVAAELRRLRRHEASALADELDPSPTPPDGSPNPSGTLSEGGTLSEPPRSVSVSVSESPSVVGSVGEPPTEFCPRHPNGTDKACFACGQARKAYPERKALWDAERASAAVVARNAAIKACNLCDEFGEVTFDDSVRKCDHGLRLVENLASGGEFNA